MSRLRVITERDRLAEAAEQVEQGERVDWSKVATLQALDIAAAGRAALVDALDREAEADAEFEQIFGSR